MSDPFVKNIVLYTLSILAGALAAGLGVLATQLAGSGAIEWRLILAAAIGPVVAGLAASRLPRPEGAHLAAQVDDLKDAGVPRRAMVVVPRDEGQARASNGGHGHAG